MSDTPPTRAQEWRRFGMFPVAGALGYAFGLLHVYGFGPYFEPIGNEFGWSRTQVSVGLTTATLVQAVFAVPVGMAVDRFGPRRIGLAGVPLTGAALVLMSTATGTMVNWLMLWVLLGLAVLGLQATVWASAIASRFSASRGLALGVMLAGGSVAATVFPWMATALIEARGWRSALAWQAGLWFALTFPIVLICFRGTPADGKASDKAPLGTPGQTSFFQGLRSPIYLRLLLACLFFAVIMSGLVVHFVPILTDRGMDRLEAAKLAGLIGIASMGGRIGTGLLLDRFSGPMVGAGIQLMPVIGSLALVLAGSNPLAAALAAILIGLAVGSEVDVISYLISRYFGLANFGALYGGALIILSGGSGLASLGAAWIFDRSGSYASFLWLAAAFTALSAMLFATLPRPVGQAHGH